MFSVAGKDMPFRCGWNDYINRNSTYDSIRALLTKFKDKDKAPKTYVIDDSQYLLLFEEMSKTKEKGYEKFTDMAQHFFDLLRFAQNELPSDWTIYFLHHSKKDDQGFVSVMTTGKMLSEKIKIEGLFTIVLIAEVDQGKHYFLTNNEDGMSVAKSPMGMFEELKVDNDLKMVDDTIRDYYGIKKEAEKNGSKQKKDEPGRGEKADRRDEEKDEDKGRS